MALIDILVRAQDQASATLNRVSGSGQKLETRFEAASRKVTTAGQRVQGLQSKIQGLTLPIVAAGALFAKFASDSIQAASSQNEAVNKTSEIFDAAAAKVLSFSDTSARSFGIAKTAALSAAAGFGNILQVSGLTEQASADMSVSLVKLAADLASFNDIAPEEALEKLRSGLVGEAEPLRTVGVLLSETRVQQEAYSSGIAKTGEKLTEAQKVQARYNLILQDTAKAQGDFARTSDGFANKQRIQSARWQDISAKLGKAVLPVMEQLQSVIGALLPLLDVAAKNLRGIAIVLGGYFAFRAIPKILVGVATALQAMGFQGAAGAVGARGVGLAMTGLGPAGAVAAGAALAVSYGLSKDAEAAAEARDRIDELANAYASGALSGEQLSHALDEQGHQVYVVGEGQKSLAENMGATTREVIDQSFAIGRAAMAQAQFARETDQGGDSLEEFGQKAGEAAQRARNFAHLTDEELGELVKSAKTTFDAMGSGLDGVTRKWGLTSNAAARASQIVGDKQRQIATDLGKLDELPIGDKLKARLLELGPDAVHAFVTGNRNQRAKIRAGLKEYDQAVRDTADRVEEIASTGGKNVGRDLMTGAVAGVVDGSPKLSDAARDAVLRAIQSARDAADAQSPSRKMAALGADLIDGLMGGMRHRLDRLLDVVRDIMGQEIPKTFRDSGRQLADAVREHERLFDRLLTRAQDRLQKLQDTVRSFRDKVASGFSDAGRTVGALLGAFQAATAEEADLRRRIAETEDAIAHNTEPDRLSELEQTLADLKAQLAALGGPGLSGDQMQAFLANLLAQQQQLGTGLSQLSDMGLDPDLLGELSSQGTDALPFIQALIAGGQAMIDAFNQAQAAIDAIEQQTEDRGVDKAFGDRLEAAAASVDRLRDRIDRFVERMGERIQKFIEALRTTAVAKGIDELVAAINRALATLSSMSASSGSVPGFAHGGVVQRTGLAFVHAGETVVPKGGMTSSRRGEGNHYHLSVIANKTEVSEAELLRNFRRMELLAGAREGG